MKSNTTTTTVFNSFSSSFYFFFWISSIFVSWSTLLLSSPHRVVVAFSLLNSEGEALLSLLNNNFSFESGEYYSVKKLDWNNLSSSNISTCDWEGIGCNTQNTHVVSLNLSGYEISGQLGHQIGRLSYLESLDLSGNRFNGSIPVELWNCSYLQHLNLSIGNTYGDELSGFSGQLGPQIGQLSYLQSLDLGGNSFNGSIPVELWNCSRLQHLDLSNGKIYADESSSGLSGQLGPHIGRLRYFKYLNLRHNRFNGSIPVELWNCSRLQHLDLSLNLFVNGGFSGQLHIGRLRYLKYVDLSYSSFNGSIPVEIWNCSRLQHLDLSWSEFSGELPTTIVRNLQQLIYFSASGNYLIGSIPEALFEISGLEYVNLGSNIFNSSIPFNIGNATNMKTLILSRQRLGYDSISLTRRWKFLGENELHGSIPSSITNCTKLEVLDLSETGLSGEIPLGFWRIPTLASIDVHNNNLSGVVLPVEITTGLHHLSFIDLSNNHFSGWIPEALGINSTSLGSVDFRNNSFSGEVPPNLCFGKQLWYMDLSLNQFHGNIPPSYTGNCDSLRILTLGGNKLNGSFPHFGKNPNLEILDISKNNIQGRILPSSICNLTSLWRLDLYENQMNGTLPQCLGGDLNQLYILNLQNNDFSGTLPSSICNLVTSLYSLDFSENNLNGTLPQCLGDFNQLYVLNLRDNDFSGTLPPEFTSDLLYMVDLNGNRFEGKIPRFQSSRLQYLDLGNNQFNDTLEEISSSNALEILVLRSNKLYGPLKPLLRTYLNFTQLKVLDISSNYFTGNLPLEFILGLQAMKHINNVENIDNQDYILYPNIMTVIIHKGKETTLNATFIQKFRAIDMSNNKLQGTIPESIGGLVWLKMLNLSSNNLTGHIPSSIGNLTELESLDLSQNKLSGEIPRHLTDIQFLSVFNVSHNNLTGRIPNGRQFQTFSNDSFSENHGLCGLPLPMKCKDDTNNESHQDLFKEKESDEDSNNSWNFGWEPVAIGYGCGVLIGLVIQYFVFTKAFLYRWFGL